MGLSKCAADDRGQKNHRGGQEHSRENLSSQSNAASSSRPTRLTGRIEFGGPQFHYGHRTHYNTYLSADSRKNRGSVGCASEISKSRAGGAAPPGPTPARPHPHILARHP